MLSYDKLYSLHKNYYTIYLNKLILVLNDYHKKQYTKEYWEPIIGLFLRKLIFNYIFLNMVIKKKNFLKKANLKNFKYYKDFTDFENDSDFEKIEKRYFLKADHQQNLRYFKFNKVSYMSSILNFIRIIPLFILVKLNISKIFFQESYFKKNLKNFFSLRSYFYFITLPSLKFKNFKINKEIIFQNRLDLIKKNENKDQKDYLLQNLIFFMPINYIENFDIISKEVNKIPITQAFYSDGNEVKFDYVKFYISKLKLNNKKIFIGQHSLRTGLESHDIYSDFSKSISNFYLTWGWKEKINSIIQFSSMRIFSSIKKYRKVKIINEYKDINICFILSAFSQIGYCFADNFLENNEAEKARIDILQKIKKLKKCKITLKPRDGSFIINNKKNFYNKFKILENKTRMYEIFGNHDIVIFERLSLGIAESIHLNQPTIFYYPKYLYKQKNKKYNELLTCLKKSSIYFDDKKKIYELLKSKKNIFQWWNEKKNQKNRKIFIKKFARCFNYNDLEKIKSLI